jgi:hypothetical protein
MLLGCLEAGGFRNYIASGGGRDFMRPISQEVYGVPRQRVIGSSVSLAYQPDEGGGTIVPKPEMDVLDDGPEKPVRIWNRVGRRPLLAAGNSNGDIPMLAFAEQALQLAGARGWTVVSIKDDWVTVFQNLRWDAPTAAFPPVGMMTSASWSCWLEATQRFESPAAGSRG